MTPDAVHPSHLLTRRAVLRGVGLGLLGAAGWEAGSVLAGPNFHAVIPGLVYRTSQPSADRLERLLRRYGIRTVVNFRGVCEDARWYLGECRVTNRHGVSQEDLNGCSAGRLLSTQVVRELVRILDRSAYPLLFHCNRGIDRTGLASAVVLLLRTETPLAEARKQLGFRYGHLPWGKTGNMDRLLDLYEEWLTSEGRTHSREVFRRWLTSGYCPGECRAAIVALDPLRVPAGTPYGLRVRCTNTSVNPWRLRPGSNAGVHAVFFVDDAGGALTDQGKAGLFDAVVAPGQGIDLTLGLAPLAPGRYTLRVDLIDEQHAMFFQVGSEPLIAPLEVA